MKKILVIGGTGFIGFHLLKKALKKKVESILIFKKKTERKEILKKS